ncbi:MAG: hypothetical protein JWM59_1181 [Verrucomicrobiales bacterium]|nr:hypothetical protein [Verrucomicrobiales bacterium]
MWWSALKAAFRHRERMPLLGNVPVNILAVATFAALGFGHQVFWWAGAGLEAAWLFLCVTSPRYRRAALLPARQATEARAAEQQRMVFLQLDPRLRQRHETLRGRIRRIAGLWQESGSEAAGTGLDQLEWLHLKFLLAKQHLEAAEAEAPRDSIGTRLAGLRSQLAQPDLAPATRASHEATVAIVEQRLAASAERARRLEGIEASLHRIEQQVELTLEKALLSTDGTGQTHSLDLASHTLAVSSELFGSTLPAVSDLDDWYSMSRMAE